MKINNVPWTMEDARAARERARELVRQSQVLIQNSNALLEQEQKLDESTPHNSGSEPTLCSVTRVSADGLT